MLTALHTLLLRRRLVRWLAGMSPDNAAPTHALWCALMGHRARCHYPAHTITEFGRMMRLVDECHVSMADLRRAYLIDPALKPYVDQWHVLTMHCLQAFNTGDAIDHRKEMDNIALRLEQTAEKSREIEQQTKLPRK